MNFNEISRKNVTYDDIKSDKKAKLDTLQTAYFFKLILRINETPILAFSKLAIFHSISIRTSLRKIVRKITR